MKKSTLVPLILTVWLVAMAVLGYSRWADGTYSSLRYFGVIAVTILLIIFVHLHLKRYPRRRRGDD